MLKNPPKNAELSKLMVRNPMVSQIVPKAGCRQRQAISQASGNLSGHAAKPMIGRFG